MSITAYRQSKVKIIEILSPPVSVGITTNQNIEKFAEIAKNNPQLLPKVTLGTTSNGKLYAITHHDVILGCKKAGPNIISEIDCEIRDDCTSLADILVSHVREITANEMFNPVCIYETIDFLEENLQKNKKDILELLCLNGTFYEKLILSEINKYISEESIQRLQNITVELSQRNLLPSMIATPPYVLSKVSRLESAEQQLELIDEIQSDLEQMSNGAFAWHTPEQIDHIIRSNRQEANHEANNREESIVAYPTKTANVGQEKSKGKKRHEDDDCKANEPTTSDNPKQNQKNNHKSYTKKQAITEETETIRKSIPNMIIIPDEKTGNPKMLVNKKTGAVSQIERSENKDIIKTLPLTTKSLYSIPLDVTKHLEFEEDYGENKTRHKNFESIPELREFLKTFSKSQMQSKLTLFWNSA